MIATVLAVCLIFNVKSVVSKIYEEAKVREIVRSGCDAIKLGNESIQWCDREGYVDKIEGAGNRIINGGDAHKEDHPWIVYLEICKKPQTKSVCSFPGVHRGLSTSIILLGSFQTMFNLFRFNYLIKQR